MLLFFVLDMDQSDLERDEEGFSYRDMLRRDRRRWSVADQDGDDALTNDEFAGFLHPEEAGHMRDLVVLETMEDIDKDKDGKISMQEYIGKCFDFHVNYSITTVTNKLLLLLFYDTQLGDSCYK